MTGGVECDASVMDGTTLGYGAVGAVSGVRNPVLAALSIMEQEKKGLLTLGRVPPMLVLLKTLLHCVHMNEILLG